MDIYQLDYTALANCIQGEGSCRLRSTVSN